MTENDACEILTVSLFQQINDYHLTKTQAASLIVTILVLLTDWWNQS